MIKLEIWDGAGYIITYGGTPIGNEVARQDGRIISEWLRSAIKDVEWLHRHYPVPKSYEGETVQFDKALAPERFIWEVTLFDNSSNREKAKILDKWEIICDDSRNPECDIESFVEWGKSYRVTIEEIK